MTYFSKLFARFSKAPKSTTAPSPAPVAEPIVVEVAEPVVTDAPAIDGD
jgi:hypothetical protein